MGCRVRAGGVEHRPVGTTLSITITLPGRGEPERPLEVGGVVGFVRVDKGKSRGEDNARSS